MKEFLPLASDLIANMAHQEDKIKRFFQTKELFEIEWIPLEILRSTYQGFVNRGEIVKIEDLEKEEKERLWRIISHWVKGGKEFKVECCQILHLIEVLQDMKISI